MEKEKFKFLKHTADIKFQAFGKNLEESFENAGYALVNIMYKGKVKLVIKKRIEISGKDKESLLYNFLEEFLFLLDSENFFLAKISDISINKNKDKYKLKAGIMGDNADNYKTGIDVKAITYNEMFVKKEKNKRGKYKYKCQVVVDV